MPRHAGSLLASNRATALHATHGDYPGKEPVHIENWIRERVHYSWIVVAVTFVTLLASVRPSRAGSLAPTGRRAKPRPAKDASKQVGRTRL